MIQKFTLESHHDRLLLQGLLVLPEQKPPRAVFQVAVRGLVLQPVPR